MNRELRNNGTSTSSLDKKIGKRTEDGPLHHQDADTHSVINVVLERSDHNDTRGSQLAERAI